MNRNITALIIILASCLVLLFNCGGNGKQDTIYVCVVQTEYWSSTFGTIPSDLMGNYTLSGFDYDFYTVIGNYIRTLSEDNFDSYSGTMSISTLSVEQSYSITGSAVLTGHWYVYLPQQSYTATKGSVTWEDATTGTIIIDDIETFFTVSGEELSLTYPLSCFLLEDTTKGEPEPLSSVPPAGPARSAAVPNHRGSFSISSGMSP